MIVRTFTGSSVRETLQMVRDTFGADAVILETRVGEDGARGPGASRGGVVITAAAEPRRPQTAVTEGPRSLYLKGDLAETPAAPPITQILPPPPERATEVVAPAAGYPHDHFEPILRELRGISRNLRSSSADETLWETMRRWLSAQPSLSAGIVETFVTFLIDALPPHQGFLDEPARSQTILAVGARGVGKSAFIFKGLAARWQAIQRKPNLTILSVSPEHGHEHLQALSAGCGVEFSAVALGQTRRPRIDSGSSDNTFAEYVGGRADDNCEAHAKMIRRALKPDIVALVLNATSSQRVWRQQLNRFAVLAPTHLVFTHWDESQPWWEAITFSGQSRLPLAYRISGFEAFGEIDPFTATDIQSGITDHVIRSLGSSDSSVVRNEDAS